MIINKLYIKIISFTIISTLRSRAVAQWHKWHKLPADGTQVDTRLARQIIIGGECDATIGGLQTLLPLLFAVALAVLRTLRAEPVKETAAAGAQPICQSKAQCCAESKDHACEKAWL